STKPIEERDPKKVAAGSKGGRHGGRRGAARAKFQPKQVLRAIGATGGRAKGVACAKRRDATWDRQEAVAATGQVVPVPHRADRAARRGWREGEPTTGDGARLGRGAEGSSGPREPRAADRGVREVCEVLTDEGT